VSSAAAAQVSPGQEQSSIPSTLAGVCLEASSHEPEVSDVRARDRAHLGAEYGSQRVSPRVRLSCGRLTSRQTPARVDGMLDCSWPGETWAAAAEDTGKRSPSMGLGYSLSYQIGKEQPTDYILPLERYKPCGPCFPENQ